MRYRLALLIVALAGLLFSDAALADRRVALVVGNSQYVNTVALRNPANDAEDVAASLRKLGFEVLVGLDLDQQGFARQIDEFGRALEGADVGLFFYAGHGLQINEKNYLVSTNAKLESEFLVPTETIELDAVIRLMESRTVLNLVFLDACRNNPLAETLRRRLIAQRRAVSLGRGLAKVEATGRDTLIAFSAAPGQEASDGEARNSPFAASLVSHLPKAGLEVSVMLKLVAADVRKATQNAQRPQQLSDMTQAFYFLKPDDVPSPAPVAALTPPPVPAPTAVLPPAPAPAPTAALTPPPAPRPPAPTQGDKPSELAAWQAARASNDCEQVRAFLRSHPNGAFADLATISEQRLCAPPKPVAALPSRAIDVDAAAAAPAPLSKAELARNIQLELLRVGCGGIGAMKANGQWDVPSQGALRLFNRFAKVNLDVANPSQATIDALRARDGRVCPVVCSKGFEARGDTCVALPPPPPKVKQQAAKPKPEPREQKVTRERRPPREEGSAPPPQRAQRGPEQGPPPQRAQRGPEQGPPPQQQGGGLLGPGLLLGIGGGLLGIGR